MVGQVGNLRADCLSAPARELERLPKGLPLIARGFSTEPPKSRSLLFGKKSRDNIFMAVKGERPSIETIRHTNLILEGLQEAVHDTFREHKLLGLPITIWQDGKAVWLQPEDITPEDMGEAPGSTKPSPPRP
jgi:hypothetical protein